MIDAFDDPVDDLPRWPITNGPPKLPDVAFGFVRHGQTDWNLENRAQGQTDIPLNQAGRKQAQDLAQRLPRNHFASICASPLSRAWETAQILANPQDTPVVPIPNLKEAGWGVREGTLRNEWFSQWVHGIATPTGAEQIDTFLDRALDGILKALEATPPVLIVSHGAVYWALQRALGEQAEDLPNCQIRYYDP